MTIARLIRSEERHWAHAVVTRAHQVSLGMIYGGAAGLGTATVGSVLLLFLAPLKALSRQRTDGFHARTIFDSSLARLWVLFFSLLVVSAVSSNNPAFSLAAALGFIAVVSLTFLGTNMLEGEEDNLRQLLAVAGWVVLIPGVYATGITAAYRYWYVGAARATGITGGPNWLGTVAALSIPLTLGHLEYSRRRYRPLVLGASTLGLVTLVISGSRGAWLASLCALGAYTITDWRKLVLIVVVIAVIFAAFADQPYLRGRFQRILRLQDPRLGVWSSALNMLRDNMALGVGPGLFAARYPEYRDENAMRYVAGAHNILLQVACEVGLLGGLIYLGILVSVVLAALKVLFQGKDPLYRGIAAAFVAATVHAQLDLTFYGLQGTAIMWFLGSILYYFALPSLGKARTQI